MQGSVHPDLVARERFLKLICYFIPSQHNEHRAGEMTAVSLLSAQVCCGHLCKLQFARVALKEEKCNIGSLQAQDYVLPLSTCLGTNKHAAYIHDATKVDIFIPYMI